MSGILQACCCGEAGCTRDCIWQAEIDSGCCHKDDTLLLWCERPGFATRTQYFCPPGLGGEPAQEYCCTYTQQAEDPIQAIYEYEGCYYRCIKMLGFTPLIDIAQPPEMCPPDACSYDNSSPPQPTPCLAYHDTSCNQFPPCVFPQSGCCDSDPAQNCVTCCDQGCLDPGLNAWRRGRMSVKDIWKWAIEASCHNGGQPISSDPACESILGVSQCARLAAMGTFGTQMLCVVHFERWWKIAECATGVRIYVPGCTQTETETNCGGTICQTDDLVPNRWIFACSGIPLYAGDLIDSIHRGVLTQAEAESIINDLAAGCTHPSQALLKKLADAGYLRANDWRDEQRRAYQELHAKFPSSGYGGCIEPVSSMHPLGPFRKRMTFKNVGVSSQPILRKADVVTNPDLAALQADCFISFPGGTQADYEYWAERQWVYFRGRPGGWAWVGWSPGAGTGCLTEVDAILNGYGRFDPTCIDALKGGGCRSPGTSAPCQCCNDIIDPTVICTGCTEPSGCTAPIAGCSPPEICNVLTGQPFCEGMRFTFFKYEAESTYVAPNACCAGPRCCACTKTECNFTQNSFLVGARRSVDSWLDKIPYTCRNENPPLPAFNQWAEWARTHPVPKDAICDPCDSGYDPNCWCWCGCDATSGTCPGGSCATSEYCNRACCGGLCPSQCGCDPATWEPLSQITGNCPAQSNCPPHSTPGQIACIGHEIECTET